MKHLRNVLTLVLAAFVALVVATPAFAAVAEKRIQVNGLEAGDNVKYYKVIEWKSDGSGWAFVSPFNTALSQAEQNEIIGTVDTTTTPPTTVAGKITDATAAKMGAVTLGDALNGSGDTVAEGSTTWTVSSDLAPGLYMALITGANPDAEDGETMHVYNPVFLAVQADNTGSEITLPLNYPESGTAKKSDVTIDKKAKKTDGTWVDATSENVGDVIDFKVEVTVPAYLESWTNPSVTVTDTLSDGLTLAVKDGEGDAALTDVTLVGAITGNMTENNQYSIVKAADGYTITFKDGYLKSRTTAELVTITYKAKITSDAKTVNPETNTAKITYSNNPNDSSKHGEKEDKTTHYTFSIDADLFGAQDYESSEIIKVGVDKAGNIITTTETTYDNGEKHMPLAGAEFKLYKSDGTTPYTNSEYTADTIFITNSEGKLMVKDGQTVGIHGLEEGTYVLKETTPPTGYMLMTAPVTFVISATYTDVAATETCNAYKELASYTVTVDGQEVSTYEMDNGTATKRIKLDDEGHAGDVTHEIKNTQGQSLPSTGGMGTTILYTIGGIMLVGGAVALVSRKRVANMEK